jgi:lipid-binding SYLF domain-containing protein
MPMVFGVLSLAFFAGTGCGPDSIAYQSFQDARVVSELRLDGKIDGSTFADAEGVVILEIGGGALGIGMMGGHGVALRRLNDAWSAPLPLDYISGSIGLQIGGKTADIVLVFRSAEAFDDFVFDGTRFIAKASGTAIRATGTVGDPMKNGDTTVISIIKGLYGGAVIGGLGVSIDEKLMLKSYGDGTNPHGVLDGSVGAMSGAESLWSELDR